MKKTTNIPLWIILIIAAIAYISLSFGTGLWYDEVYSMAMVRHSFSEICSITAQDVHPPLYYFMLKCFIAPFGYSVIAARMFSIIPVLLTVLMGYFKLKDIANKRAGILFAIMFVFMPIMSMFSVQLRMYSWSMLAVTGCGLFAITALRDDKIRDYIVFMLFGVMAAYLHYFALVSAGVIYILLFIGCVRNKKLKKFIFTAIGTVILYLPWLAAFVSQLAEKVENEYWIAPITLKIIGEYFLAWFKCGNMTKLYLGGSIIIGLCAIVPLLFKQNKPQRALAFNMSLVFVLTNIIGIVASIVVRPVFIERYAVPAIPLLLASGAIGLSLIESRAVTIIVSVFFAAGFCVNYPHEWQEEYNASEIQLKEYLDDADYEALICYVDSHLYGVLSYYASDTIVYRPKLSKGSPFDNIHALSEFNTDTCVWAALFLPKGAEIPSELAEQFNIDFVRVVSTYGIDCDMYNLWK